MKQLGYYTGSVDGDFGDATEKALRAFQDRNNLLVDGIAGKSTMAKLNSSNAVKAAAATATPRKTATPKPQTTATPNLSTEYYLQSGSSGTRVRTLQARLIELGWMAGSPDGNYEGATEYAVKAFQKSTRACTPTVSPGLRRCKRCILPLRRNPPRPCPPSARRWSPA